jgi:tetratricopeptide (TPR) repeat protein
VRSLLDVDGLPASVFDQILARAEGNPFFLEEIVRQLVDNGSVRLEAGRWRAAGDVGHVEIPDTVQGVLAARIDLLEPPDRRVLQAAAVVGRIFWPGAIRRLLNGAADRMPAALLALEERDLVRSRLASSLGDEPEYIFKHVLTRDVAYDTLPRRDRSAAHASIAAWLEETLGERAREFLELLAYHWLEAYRSSASTQETDAVEIEALRRHAFDRTLQAAQETRRRYALKKSERLASQAIDLASTPRERSLSYEASAEAYFHDYDGDEAWRGFTAAAEAELDARPADPVRVSRLAARAVEISTRWPGSMRSAPGEPEVRRVLDLGLEYLPTGDSRERVQLLGNKASWPFAFPSIEFTDSELDRIEIDGLEAAEIAIRLGDADLASAALDQATAPALRRGRYGRAIEIEGRRLELLPRLRDQVEIGDVYAMMAWCSGEAGRWSDLLHYASEGERTVEVAINSRLHILAWLTEGRYRTGDWDGAVDSFATVAALLDDRRDDPPHYVFNAFGSMALIHTFRGERSEADRLMDLLQRVEAAAGDTTARIWPYVNRLLVARGSIEEAWERLQHPPAGWRLAGACQLEAMCEWVPVADRWDLAADIIVHVRKTAEEGDLVGARLFADRLAGLLTCREGGDLGPGIALLAAARDGFLEQGAVWEAARTDVSIAEAVGVVEMDRAQRERLGEALDLFERLGSVAELRRARAAMAPSGG